LKQVDAEAGQAGDAVEDGIELGVVGGEQLDPVLLLGEIADAEGGEGGIGEQAEDGVGEVGVGSAGWQGGRVGSRRRGRLQVGPTVGA
jgi:hypothetical protein